MKKIFQLFLFLLIISTGYYLFIVQGGHPSNDRNWSADQAILPSAEFSGMEAKVANVRNFKYRSAADYDTNYYDATYNLDGLKSVDFIIVPFKDNADAAHTFVSFGFSDGRYLAISPEIRKEKGEKFSAIKGLFNQYELMYVIADEKDVIGLRANYRHDQVYLYPASTTPALMKKLFIVILERANSLKEKPEYYNTIFNSCTVNLAKQINKVNPGRIKLDRRLIMSGKADELAINLGLLATDLPLAEARQKFNINALAEKYRDAPDFSQKIRNGR